MSTEQIEGQDAAEQGAEGTVRSWAMPENRPHSLGREDMRRWEETVEDVRVFALANNLSMGEVSRRSDVPQGTFSPWYAGKWKGSYANITLRLRKWLDAEAEQADARHRPIQEPVYVETPLARKLNDALIYAQSAPAIVLVTLGSGLGKTTVSRRYCETRPNAYRVVLRPSIGNTHSVMSEIARVLGIRPGAASALTAQIGERLRRNGRHTLLILDEAQNLKDVAFDELRHLLDEYGCGLALLGNDEIYSRWGKAEPKEGFGQLHRRIGKRVRELKASAADIDTYVAAWGLEDEGANRLLAAIGRKPGSLGQIAETIRLAAMLAMAHARPPNVEDVRRAWENRSGEQLR